MAATPSENRQADLDRFYGILERLRGSKGDRTTFKSINLHVAPKRGVYYFFQQDEFRASFSTDQRVVRVGTHGLVNGTKSTLQSRLRQHRGTTSGGGNHRGSIFRLLVGDALIQTQDQPKCPTWGHKGQRKQAAAEFSMSDDDVKRAEQPIEQAVSNFIGEMIVTCINVDDEPGPDSCRGYLEKNSIALLSNHKRTPIDHASPTWLGHHSSRDLVRGSGLWNQRNVADDYDPNFLEQFERLIERQLSAR